MPRWSSLGWFAGALLFCAAQASADPPPPAPPPSPAAFVVGTPAEVEVPGDRPVYVLHAAPGLRRVLVYLHGWCGRVEAVEAWKQAATSHGTLIAPTADIRCPNGRRRWGKRSADTDLQHERIQRAIRAVREARGGDLDPTDVVLIGYSQGAARAYRLAQRYPRFYSRLVLGGPPERPSVGYLGRARAVAVLGGELETTEKMREGLANLQEAGRLSRYFMLPAARHGEYGPQAEAVMGEVLDWLLRVAPHAPSVKKNVAPAPGDASAQMRPP